MKNEKKEYTAPELTVVTFKTERGYAASGLGLSYTFTEDPVQGRSQESWTNDNSYLGNSWS